MLRQRVFGSSALGFRMLCLLVYDAATSGIYTLSLNVALACDLGCGVLQLTVWGVVT